MVRRPPHFSPLQLRERNKGVIPSGGNSPSATNEQRGARGPHGKGCDLPGWTPPALTKGGQKNKPDRIVFNCFVLYNLPFRSDLSPISFLIQQAT
jgi:hypothetical protein